MSISYRNLDPNTSPENVYGLMINNEIRNTPDIDMHTHKDYNEIFLVTQGNLCHVVNGQHQAVSEMQLCFVRSTDVHAMTTYGYDNSVSFFNIGIPGLLFEKTLAFFGSNFEKQLQSELPPVVSLNIREYKSLLQKIDDFQSVPFGEYHGCIFMSMLSDMIYCFLKPDSNSMFEIAVDAPEWFLKLINEMRDPKKFTVGISEMRDIVGYSQEHISRAFKKYLNLTSTEYINILRVSYAKKLMTEKKINVIDACYTCGFKSLSNFYRIFNQYYGMSPKQLLKLEKQLI